MNAHIKQLHLFRKRRGVFRDFRREMGLLHALTRMELCLVGRAFIGVIFPSVAAWCERMAETRINGLGCKTQDGGVKCNLLEGHSGAHDYAE